MLETLSFKLKKIQFGKKLQQAFLEDLTTLVEDGVPANQAIETIQDISSNIQANVAESVAGDIAQGKSLADGLQPWMPSTIVEIIRSGEHGGNLVEALKSATNTLNQEDSSTGEILSAILYPCVIITLALILLVFIKNSVLVNFIDMKPVSQWPSSGRNLYEFATFIQHWWWMTLLLILFFTILFSHLLKNLTGSIRLSVDELPIVSLYRQINAARLMQTLGLFLTHGIVLKNALKIMRKNASPYLAWHLLNMEYRLSDGNENLADVLDTQLIQKTDLTRLKVVAKGKGFEHALTRLGELAQKKNSKTIALTAKIVGGLLLALGAFIAVSVIFGIYSVGSTIVA